MTDSIFSICFYILLGVLQPMFFYAQPVTCHGLDDITTFELNIDNATVTGNPGELGTTYLYQQADPGNNYDVKVTVMAVSQTSPNGELYDPLDDEQGILPSSIDYHHFFSPIWQINDGVVDYDYMGSHTYKFEFFLTGTSTPATINVIATSVDNDGLVHSSAKYREQVIYGSSPDSWLVHPDAALIIVGDTITATDPPLNDPGLQATNQSAIGAYYSSVSEITWTSNLLVNDFTPDANSFVRHSALSFVCETSLVLPIELFSFDVKRQDKNAIITWTTQSEVNNDYFIIERSAWPNMEFTSISDKIKGFEFSNEKHSYTFEDERPGGGILFYRLKQVDFDGAYSYSNVKSIHFSDSNNSISIYPNPAIDELSLQLENMKGEVSLKVFDISGQPVYQRIYPEEMWTDSQKINVLNWHKGVYIIEVKNQGHYWTKVFLKG